MNYEYNYIQNRLSSILSENDMARISLKSKDGICMIVDVHGMKCFQVKRLINNIINAVRIFFQLIIIHCYNHGTAIKDMLAERCLNVYL